MMQVMAVEMMILRGQRERSRRRKRGRETDIGASRMRSRAEALINSIPITKYPGSAKEGKKKVEK